jgi:hypothetical protein
MGMHLNNKHMKGNHLVLKSQDNPSFYLFLFILLQISHFLELKKINFLNYIYSLIYIIYIYNFNHLIYGNSIMTIIVKRCLY